MAATVPVDDFIQQVYQDNIPVIDVRSPAEFLHAHFPLAQNIPLLTNEERVIIGTTYKQKGREEAVQKGFKLVGPRFHEFIDKAKEIAPDKKIAIYCWRGGMRSNIVAWILSMGGFQTILLKGGYKSFRNWCFAEFNEPKNIIVLGGKTGSGKTEMLQCLKDAGEQIIDLENLANHKGSAFGSLGMPAQPSTEQFENFLAIEWWKISGEKIVWLENESRTIGKNIIPDKIFEQMRTANVLEITIDDAVRKKRILNEYGNFSNEELADKTKLIAKRLGNDLFKQSLQFLEDKNLDGWVNNMLVYYDKTYRHSGALRSPSSINVFNCGDDMYEKHVAEIISKANSINKQFSLREK